MYDDSFLPVRHSQCNQAAVSMLEINKSKCKVLWSTQLKFAYALAANVPSNFAGHTSLMAYLVEDHPSWGCIRHFCIDSQTTLLFQVLNFKTMAGTALVCTVS